VCDVCNEYSIFVLENSKTKGVIMDIKGMMLELAEKQADAMKDKMIDELGSEDMASKIASAINKKIDIPFVSEEKEQIFFEKCVDVVTDIIEGMFKK
tara:strand:- start:586 stop:876 length:291 start_codon:yes stop_codon:yes gene_type:complete